MGFEDLTDVHTRWNAQWVQNDVNRRTVFIVRHIFDRVDLGDNTLVPVTTRHFVTRLNLTFNGQIHLNDFQHAWCQIVALGDFTALGFEFFLKLVLQLVILLCQLFQLILLFFVSQAQFKPALARQLVQFFRFNTAGNQHVVDTGKQACFENLQLFSQVFLNLLQLHLFDLQRTLIFFHAIAGKDLNVDNRTGNTVRHTQRGIFNV